MNLLLLLIYFLVHQLLTILVFVQELELDLQPFLDLILLQLFLALHSYVVYWWSCDLFRVRVFPSDLVLTPKLLHMCLVLFETLSPLFDLYFLTLSQSKST